MASVSEKLRVLDEAMTPKPWASMRHEAHPEAWTLHSPDGETRGVDGMGIATLRNSLPAIIACIENLERFDWDREAQEALRVLNEGLAK